MAIRWVTGFIDVPADFFDAALLFWSEATASTPSARRGERDQFATLLPAGGDACWRLQAIVDGPGGGHLDLHVDDVPGDTAMACGLGATEVFAEDGLTVLRSPGGLGICLSRWDGESVVPPPTRWPKAGRSRLDQICIDIPPARFDSEAGFLTALTGWRPVGSTRPEFRRLVPPAGLPLQLLIQRLDADDDGPVRAHPDLAATDAASLAKRHQAFGASWVRSTPEWITLRDPAGLDYCITVRDPDRIPG